MAIAKPAVALALMALTMTACTTDVATPPTSETTIASVTTVQTRGEDATHDAAPAATPLRVEVNDTSSMGTSIESVFVRNTGSTPIDIGGWVVRSLGATDGFGFPQGTTIAPGSTVGVYENAVIGETCREDTAKVFFACNEFGTARTTHDILFPTRHLQLLDPTGDVVAEGSP